LPGVGILVFKSDLVLLDIDNPFIGKSDAVDIRSKVFESMFTVTNLFRVDDPIFVPNLFGDLAKERSFLEFISKFSAKYNRESFNGDEEVFGWSEPDL
jgi:hypothetical protein